MLQALIANMSARGIEYEMVSEADQRRLEPLVRMGSVVHSVNTGIIDVASLRNACAELIEGQSASADPGFISSRTTVKRIELRTNAFASTAAGASIRLTVGQSEAASEPGVADAAGDYGLEVTKAVICAVGLYGNELWGRIFSQGSRHSVQQPPSHRLHFCKGRYTAYVGRPPPPVSRLVYPCPLPRLVGLGVHSTIDMAGAVRFGPDAIYTDSLTDYGLSERTCGAAATEAELECLLDSHYEAVRRYIPSIDRQKFAPDFAGVRPKLAGPSEPFRDFLFEEIGGLSTAADGAQQLRPVMQSVSGNPSGFTAGVPTGPRLLIVTGVESPGLTANTAIGEYVARSLLPTEAHYNTHLPPWAVVK